MKILILLSAAAFIACEANRIEDYFNEMKAIHDDCMKTSGIEKDMIKKHLIEQNVDDPKLREYLLCVSKKRGYRNEAGVYQPEVHKKALMKVMKDERMVDEMMAKCKNEKDTPEESCLLQNRCFVQEMYKFMTIKAKTKREEFVKECKTETGVTEEAVNELHEGKESADPKMKPYAMCMMKKMHTMNDAGEFNMSILKTYMYLLVENKENIHKIIEKCCKKMDTPEETAYHYALCRFKMTK